MESSKTALITGITGMVGSHLADFLLEETDWNIVGLVRWRSPLDNLSHLVPRINRGERVSLEYGDLKDSESLDNVLSRVQPDFVFHLAAQSYPHTSFSSPVDTLDTNVLGTTRLLEAVRRHAPTAVVHVCASSEVFGRVPKDQIPIAEQTAFHPASPYAISKVGTDLVGRYFAEAFDMTVMTTRMFTHTGPRRGDVFAESSFAKQIALAEAGLAEPIVKVGNLGSLRTIADVRDAVRAYYLLATVHPVPGEAYNIGGTHTVTVRGILDHLIGLSTVENDLRIVVDESRIRPIDADLQVPDSSKFAAHTGWSPRIPFEQTMQDLLDYWRQRVRTNGNTFLTR